MGRKAIFLDKDGTLIEDVPYNVNPDRMVLTTGAAQALQQFHQAGYLLIVITNQAGVAHGFFPEAALDAVKHQLQMLLQPVHVPLAGFYYCPHYPNGVVKTYAIACNCRKPKPGLLLTAAQDHDINLHQSWCIGDILNDVEAGRLAGCRTILINNGNETEWDFSSPARLPHFQVANLLEAARVILGSSAQPLPEQLY